MRTLWRSLVQPHIAYCGQLWHPSNLRGDIEEMEQVLRTFTRRIPQVRDLNYWECLKQLKMMSLQRRSERYKILYTWKVVQGIVPNYGISWSSIEERRGRKIAIPRYVKDQNPEGKFSRDRRS
jgi:hypothetical protein